MISIDKLSYIANKVGLSICGVSSLEDYGLEEAYLEKWQKLGLAGELKYMLRDPKIFTDLSGFQKGVKTVISFACFYNSIKKDECPKGFGRIARYALGRDYHRVLKKRIKNFYTLLKNEYGKEFNYRSFSDAVPILERAIAKRANIGFIGKNTMLINPKHGSFSFLAEILCDIEIKTSKLKIRADLNCGSCKRCIEACPTNAFKEAYLLDAKKCISYLTIEKKGLFNLKESSMLNEWVFGCDVCQEVCPFNHKSLKLSNIRDDDFIGRVSSNTLINLEEILNIKTDNEFLEKFKGTPLMRAKRVGLLRNAMSVVVNTKVDKLYSKIEEIKEKDLDLGLREQAKTLQKRIA